MSRSSRFIRLHVQHNILSSTGRVQFERTGGDCVGCTGACSSFGGRYAHDVLSSPQCVVSTGSTMGRVGQCKVGGWEVLKVQALVWVGVGARTGGSNVSPFLLCRSQNEIRNLKDRHT